MFVVVFDFLNYYKCFLLDLLHDRERWSNTRCTCNEDYSQGLGCGFYGLAFGNCESPAVHGDFVRMNVQRSIKPNDACYAKDL